MVFTLLVVDIVDLSADRLSRRPVRAPGHGVTIGKFRSGNSTHRESAAPSDPGVTRRRRSPSSRPPNSTPSSCARVSPRREVGGRRPAPPRRRWVSTPLRSVTRWVSPRSVKCQSMVRSSSHARGSVDPDGDGVEQLARRSSADSSSGEPTVGGVVVDPVAEFVGAHEVEVAPGAVLARRRPAARRPRPAAPWRSGGPGSAKTTRSSSSAAKRRSPSAAYACGLGHHGVGPAHALDVAGRGLDRRVRPQAGRVAVEPAEVALVDGLHVVADRPVVAVGVPGLLEGRWHGSSASAASVPFSPVFISRRVWSCR